MYCLVKEFWFGLNALSLIFSIFCVRQLGSSVMVLFFYGKYTQYMVRRSVQQLAEKAKITSLDTCVSLVRMNSSSQALPTTRSLAALISCSSKEVIVLAPEINLSGADMAASRRAVEF